MSITRRSLLSAVSAGAALVPLSGVAQTPDCAPSPFVITVQASGAWDPTFLMDPIAGDEGFTPFTSGDILSVGAIRYAPRLIDDVSAGPYLVGETPQDFFAKHASRMVVVNGVDNATVSHDVGPRVAFAGSTRDGLPTLSGLSAAVHGKDLPLALFVSGGFASSGGLVPVTRGGSLSLLRGLASPNLDGLFDESVNHLLRQATRSRDMRLASSATLPRPRAAYETLAAMRSESFESQFELVAEALDGVRGVGNRGGLADSAAAAIGLLRSGASAAAHLSTGGFDTHDGHNQNHPQALGQLLDGLDYLIEQAASDSVLSARGVVIVVGSDFGRTRYNGGGGKDHWPITSMLLFGVGAAEARVGGGLVIGGTSPSGRNGVASLPVKFDQGRLITLEEDNPDGFALTPAHVQHALRSAVGLCETGAPDDPLRPFSFNLAERDPIPLHA